MTRVSTLLVAACALWVPGTWAQSQLDVKGRVTAGTCQLDDVRVDLPELDVTALPATGEVPDGADAELLFTACQGVGQIAVTFNGNAVPADADRFSNQASVAAQDIALWLRYRVGAAMETIVPNQPRTFNVAAGVSHRIPFRVHYYRIGKNPASAGAVTANLTLTVTYQ